MIPSHQSLNYLLYYISVLLNKFNFILQLQKLKGLGYYIFSINYS